MRLSVMAVAILIAFIDGVPCQRSAGLGVVVDGLDHHYSEAVGWLNVPFAFMMGGGRRMPAGGHGAGRAGGARSSWASSACPI